MSGSSFEVADLDFESVYRGGNLINDMRFERPPWDIDAPQPVLVRTQQEGGFTGTVLDVGSGTGNNAIFLAERGYQVTGVDGSPAAVELARGRAAERGVTVRFQVEQATELAGLGQDYDTVLDSALYHCLPADARTAYAAALHRVTRPGARLHLFCFADEAPWVMPIGPVSRDDLRANLGANWDITDIALVDYQGAVTVQEAAREFGKATGDTGLDGARADEHGRIIFPVWHLRATRID